MADIDVKDALDDGDLFKRDGDDVAGISPTELAADDAFTGTYVGVTGAQSVAGVKTFTDAPIIQKVTVTDVTGTSDTIASGDLGKVLRYTDSSLVTVTLPAGLAVGSIVNLRFSGAAGGAIQDDGTSTVDNEGTVEQGGEVSCLVVATNTWSVVGPVTAA